MINVTKTYLPELNRYQSFAEDIFKSGWLTNNGKLVQQLTQELKEYLEVDHLLLVSNGTLALQVAYKLLGLSGEVVTTPFSFVATTSSLVWEGLSPVFADIDPLSLTIDPVEVEKKITSNTSAIVATHVYGNACDVEYLGSLSQKNQIPIVYDAAHAFAVKLGKESLLKHGDISILSFHSTKIFHTIEGGALVFNNASLYEKAKKMINFGIESPTSITELGINCKMNEFQAAMGLCMISDMEVILSARQRRYEKYETELKTLPELRFPVRDSKCSNNYSHFPVIFPDESTVLEAIKRMNDYNINPRRYFYPSLNTLPYLNKMQSSPFSEEISRKVLCLPLFHSLSEETQRTIIDIIYQVILETRVRTP